MPHFLLSMDDQQTGEFLGSTPNSSRFVDSTSLQESMEGHDINAVFYDPSGRQDSYVRRCIGTAQRLEEHVRNGGNVFLAYPDGSFRAIRIDTKSAQTGHEIPPPSPAMSSEARRRLKRASRVLRGKE